MDGKPDLSGDECDPGTVRPDYHDGYAGLWYRRDDDMALSGQPVNGDREEIQVRQVRRGRKATGESGEIPV